MYVTNGPDLPLVLSRYPSGRSLQLLAASLPHDRPDFPATASCDCPNTTAATVQLEPAPTSRRTRLPSQCSSFAATPCGLRCAKLPLNTTSLASTVFPHSDSHSVCGSLSGSQRDYARPPPTPPSVKIAAPFSLNSVLSITAGALLRYKPEMRRTFGG